MTTLYLIRHAESQMNAEFPHLIGGRTNYSPLTEHGKSQAEKLGLRIRQHNLIFNRWVTSPAIRTMETARIAQIICDYDDTVFVDDSLQEVDQGEWEGLERKDKYTAEVLAQMIEQRWHFKAPGGESQYEVEQRMMGFAEGCRAQYPGQKIAVFTHGVAIKCLLRFVQDWNPLNTYHTEIDNTGISIIHFSAEHKKWRMRCINDTAHLETAV